MSERAEEGIPIISDLRGAGSTLLLAGSHQRKILAHDLQQVLLEPAGHLLFLLQDLLARNAKQ
jgi:hypothetical protein